MDHGDDGKFQQDKFLGDLDGPWRRLALCFGKDPNFFFPNHGTNEERQNRKFCWPCPVRQDCLNWALETNQKDGIWGGHTEKERKAMKKEDRLKRFYTYIGEAS